KSRKLSGRGRTPGWIAFGNPIAHSPSLEKSEARAQIESELASSFKNLYAELQQTFRLTRDDLPHSPRGRMSKSARHPERSRGTPLRNLSVSPRNSSTTLHSAQNGRFQRMTATTVDSLICASINFLHARHRLNGRSREEMERYVQECERLTADQYYASPHGDNLAEALENGHSAITWRSPIETQFPANNIAHADFFPSGRGRSAPTVFILHALMSASRVGSLRCCEH